MISENIKKRLIHCYVSLSGNKPKNRRILKESDVRALEAHLIMIWDKVRKNTNQVVFVSIVKNLNTKWKNCRNVGNFMVDVENENVFLTPLKHFYSKFGSFFWPVNFYFKFQISFDLSIFISSFKFLLTCQFFIWRLKLLLTCHFFIWRFKFLLTCQFFIWSFKFLLTCQFFIWRFKLLLTCQFFIWRFNFFILPVNFFYFTCQFYCLTWLFLLSNPIARSNWFNF